MFDSMAEQSLKDKTVKGTFWSAADAFLGQGVTFIVGIVLARQLTPDEYGLIGIVTIFTTILLGFIDCGFGNALIRKQDADDNDYNTMFIVNMSMSVLMYVLLFTGAPLIARFFYLPQLVSLVRVTGLLLIIQAVSIVQDTILKKRIDFKTKTKASVLSAVSSGAVGIGMAYTGFGVWSLVSQQISRQLVYTICLWLFNHWLPKLKFSINSLRYMWGFGWKLMLSGFIDRFWSQLYQTVVGKFYNHTTLGQYTRAEQFAGIFSSNITSIIQRVSYPVLSTVQDEKGRMVSGYRRIIKTTMFMTTIVMIPIGAVSEPLIYCLIGPQWHQAATFLPYLCFLMVLYPLHAINLNMLQIQNRTDLFLYLEIIKKTLAVVPICIGIFFDIYWMLIGSIILGIVSFFLNSYYSGKFLGYTSWAQLRDVAPSFGVAFLVAISVYFLKYLPISYWIVFPIQVIVGASVFYIICELTKLPEYIEVRGIVSEYSLKLFKHNQC